MALETISNQKKKVIYSITDGVTIKLCQWLDPKHISQKLTGISIII